MAVCSKGENASDVIDAYLEAGADIPARPYVSAVKELLKGWRYPNAPLPGDIQDIAHRMLLDLRRVSRELKQREYQAQLERDAMTPTEARNLLADIEMRAPTENPVEVAGREIEVMLLEAVIGRNRHEVPQMRHQSEVSVCGVPAAAAVCVGAVLGEAARYRAVPAVSICGFGLLVGGPFVPAVYSDRRLQTNASREGRRGRPRPAELAEE